jgi:DHA1 family tetracycline resistance protein-like MFS transporter
MIGTLTTLAFAALEGTFSLFLAERMGWGGVRAALGFAMLGLFTAVVQGGLIRPLVRRYGEPRLIVAGTLLLGVGLLGMANASSLVPLLGASALVALGSGLANPSILGLLSRLTPDAEQGAIFGTLLAAQTGARMVNYLVANRLLGQAGPAAPYVEGGVLAGLAFAGSVALVGRLRASGTSIGPEVTAEPFSRSASR